MAYTLVKVTPDEVEEVQEILKRCSQHLKSNFDLGRYWDPPYPIHLMRKDAEEKAVYAVRSGRLTVGTFTVDTRPPTWFDAEKYMAMWEKPDEKAMYVGRLAVLPEYQGRGIGTWCMRRVEQLARDAGCVAVRLDAYEKYADLLRFYEKLGYQRKGTIYWKDMGTVCFEKQLA